MAIIAPFRALRYDPERVNPQAVITQPYDKITPAMQDRYYEASPYNLCRIILGKSYAGDDERSNVYTRAAQAYSDWRKNGVLKPDPEPAIYAYQQRFEIPGASAGTLHTRSGFVALLRLEDYANKVVFRHEQTLSRPRADRLNLLRATRAHFGQIFLVYEGGDELLPALPAEPTTTVRDEYGVGHRLWRIANPTTLSAVAERMRDRRVIIADGHHRYETALAFRDEQRERAAAANATGTSSSPPEAPHEYVMATFISMDSPGLVILPTHRVVDGLTGFQTGAFVERARTNFMFQDVSSLMPRLGGTGPHFEADIAQKLLRCELPETTALAADRRPSPEDVVMLAITQESTFLLYSKPGWADSVLADVLSALRQLDVVQLHKILLEKVLGMSEDDIREQRHLRYIREASSAAEEVRKGANIAFVMNPVRMQQMSEIAFAGGVLPQKSTDFYPKLLSGLTIYALE